MTNVGAVFTVRFLRNSDQIFAVRDIINQNGDGAALYQGVDPESGAVTPDWTVEANQPIIRLSLRSASDYPTQINSVTWYYDGLALSFALNGTTPVAEASGKPFKAYIDDSGHYCLRIVGNLASKTVVSNKQITYDINYTSNAQSDTIRCSVDVTIQKAGSTSYVLQVTTNRVELSADETTATLTAKAWYGTSAITIGSGGYTLQWYQGDTVLTGKTSATLTVTRDMVTGGALFVAKLMKDGAVVAQDGQRINDTADEYQIYSESEKGMYITESSSSTSFNVVLYRNNVPDTSFKAFAWTIKNAKMETKEIHALPDSESAYSNTITVTKEHCKVTTSDGEYYGDVNIIVDAYLN